MCQQWFSVAGHLLELLGFLVIVFELRAIFQRKRPRQQIFMVGAVLVVLGMVGQTAGGWVGRIPIDGIKSCY